ncbi:hypothetical protein DFJ74DRAFT_60903 [Hyaloraphidium curvatum]|nr:hypothetical protein DFJ74DRAFT_60903 [Hyaloraphidium curvatum]
MPWGGARGGQPYALTTMSSRDLLRDLDNLSLVEDSELQEFRRRWREEVESRARSAKSGADAVSASSTDEAGKAAGKDVGNRVGRDPKAISLDIRKAGSASGTALVSARLAAGTAQPQREASDGAATAVDVYDTAVRFEREGNLSKALEFYQKAFRMDDQCDSKWRKLWARGELSDAAPSTDDGEKDRPDFTYEWFERENGPYGFESSTTVATELSNIPLSFVPKKKNKTVPLAKVPDELILVVLKRIAWMDPYALVSIGLVNKKLYMLAREQVVWRDLCERTYRTFVPNVLALEAELPTYSNDWKVMFLKRPRVRHDGLYISRCHYWRPGQTDFGLTSPYLLVTYFRYLRFYRDGTAISLCTTTEPIDAVKLFRKLPKNVKSLMTGHWTLTGNRVEVVLTDRDRPNTVFTMRLAIRSTGHSCMNVAKWERYSSVQGDFDEVEYPLKTLKSFSFSRVRSYVSFPSPHCP